MVKKIKPINNVSNENVLDTTLETQKEYETSKKTVFICLRDLELRPKLSEQLTDNGTYLATLSMINLSFITYLMGLCDKKTFDAYRIFELRLINDISHEYQFQLKKKHQKLPTIELDINAPDYMDVLEYAKANGYVLSLPKIAFDKALELKRTAGLFETIKTNVNNFKLPIDDELFTSNWYDPFSEEETEYTILNELVLLQQALPYTNIELNTQLNQLICMRWQKHIQDLKEMRFVYGVDTNTAHRINFAITTLKKLMPIRMRKYTDKERKILLYQTIQKAKEVAKLYPDTNVGTQIYEWLSHCTIMYEKSLSPAIKEAKPFPLIKGLNQAFYLSQKEISTDVQETIEKTEPIDKRAIIKKENDQYIQELVQTDAFSNLSVEEKSVLMIKNYYKTVFLELEEYVNRKYKDDSEELDNFFGKVPSHLQGLVYVAELPEVYSYFILGIITKEQANELRIVQKNLFKKNGLQKLDEIFDTYMQEHDGMVAEIIEEQYEAYKTGNETGDYNNLDLNSALLNLGVSEYEIEDMEPSIQETLSFLLNKDFDQYLPLSLRFRPEYFELVENFRELAIFLTDIESGEKWLSIQNLKIPDTCDSDSSSKITINRLTVICDIFSIMRKYINQDKAKDFKKATILLQKMIYACYQKTLNDLNNLPANKHHAGVTAQLRAMSRYFMSLYPATNTLKNTDKNMAFLANVARSCLLTATPSKNIQEYYLANFDKQFGTTQLQDTQLSGFHVTTLPLRKKIPDTMDKELFDDFKADLMKRHFEDEELSINNYDERCIFGVCTDVPLLYAMGILSNFEYEQAIEIDKENQDQDMSDVGSFILNIKNKLEKENPPFYLRISNEHLKTMQQIRLAGSLIDSHYVYDNAKHELSINYNDKTASTSLADYQKNALHAEGVMLDALLPLMKGLVEENIQSTRTLQRILDSYWKESTQLLNQLALSEQVKNPDISERICHQKELFGLKDDEPQESISNRLKYYPVLFQMIQRGLNRTYTGGTQKRSIRRIYFNKEIASFVQFYHKREPKLLTQINVDRGNER